jgi:hypothetical protein
MMRYTNLQNNRNKKYGEAHGVRDPHTVTVRDQLIRHFTLVDIDIPDVSEKIKTDFFDTYKSWMFSNFNFKNTDLLQHACYTNGTTESFAYFYIRYRDNYRLRLKRCDYFYHQMMSRLWYNNKFAWLDEDDLRPGDVLLISVPFSDHGDTPEDLDHILDRCDKIGVPVMLDLAYLNLTDVSAFPYVIDFGRPCIKYVVSSLSKVFPVEHLRIGIRLQKSIDEDQLYVVNETYYNYINRLSAFVGHGLMTQFAPNYMFDKYRPLQLKMCDEMNLKPSPCFIFGIDQKNQYPEYNRGGVSNRLCFSRVWDGRAIKTNLI